MELGLEVRQWREADDLQGTWFLWLMPGQGRDAFDTVFAHPPTPLNVVLVIPPRYGPPSPHQVLFLGLFN